MQNSEKMGSLSENMRGDDVAEPAEIIEYRRQRAVRKLERKDNKRARRAIKAIDVTRLLAQYKTWCGCLQTNL